MEAVAPTTANARLCCCVWVFVYAFVFVCMCVIIHRQHRRWHRVEQLPSPSVLSVLGPVLTRRANRRLALRACGKRSRWLRSQRWLSGRCNRIKWIQCASATVHLVVCTNWHRGFYAVPPTTTAKIYIFVKCGVGCHLSTDRKINWLRGYTQVASPRIIGMLSLSTKL